MRSFSSFSMAIVWLMGIVLSLVVSLWALLLLSPFMDIFSAECVIVAEESRRSDWYAETSLGLVWLLVAKLFAPNTSLSDKLLLRSSTLDCCCCSCDCDCSPMFVWDLFASGFVVLSGWRVSVDAVRTVDAVWRMRVGDGKLTRSVGDSFSRMLASTLFLNLSSSIMYFFFSS